MCSKVQCVVVKSRRLTSEEVEAELDKRDARLEAVEGRAVIGEAAAEQLRLECDWVKDAHKRAQGELEAKRTKTVRSCCCTSKC